MLLTPTETAHKLAAALEEVVAVIDQSYLQADGTLKETGGRHRHTYVVTDDTADGWKIVAGQNTTVAAAA